MVEAKRCLTMAKEFIRQQLKAARGYGDLTKNSGNLQALLDFGVIDT
jgi:hypothetical protein